MSNEKEVSAKLDEKQPKGNLLSESVGGLSATITTEEITPAYALCPKVECANAPQSSQ